MLKILQNQIKQRNDTLLRPIAEPVSPKFSEKRMFDVLFNEWRREALKRSFYGDSDMQMCHSLTHSLRCRHWNGWNGNRTVRARRHIEIETAHHQITQKTKNFCGYSVQQIPGVAKHGSLTVSGKPG